MLDPADLILTTVDNPHNPHEQYEQWRRWDIDNGYDTESLIARVADIPTEIDDTNRRNVATALNQRSGIASDMFFLTQERQRFTPGIECHVYHLRTFRNENPLIRFQPIAQLCLGECAKHLHSSLIKCLNPNHRHNSNISEIISHKFT